MLPSVKGWGMQRFSLARCLRLTNLHFMSFACVLCLVLNSAWATEPSSAADEATAEEREQEVAATNQYQADDYQRQRAKIRASDPSADFTALRMGFLQTPAYLALMSEAQLLNKEMFGAMDKDSFEDCIDLADRALSIDYTSIHSHYGAMVCNIQLGNNDAGYYHQWVLQGLVDSLRSSGNGRDPNQPYRAISDEEVTGFLRLMGFQVQQKVSTAKDGVPLQVVTVRDLQEDSRQQLFFDTSLYQEQLSDRQLSGS